MEAVLNENQTLTCVPLWLGSRGFFFLPLIELVIKRFQHDAQFGGRRHLVALMFVEHAQDVLLLDFFQRLRLQGRRVGVVSLVGKLIVTGSFCSM